MSVVSAWIAIVVGFPMALLAVTTVVAWRAWRRYSLKDGEEE